MSLVKILIMWLLVMCLFYWLINFNAAVLIITMCVSNVKEKRINFFRGCSLRLKWNLRRSTSIVCTAHSAAFQFFSFAVLSLFAGKPVLSCFSTFFSFLFLYEFKIYLKVSWWYCISFDYPFGFWITDLFVKFLFKVYFREFIELIQVPFLGSNSLLIS